jgi:hypothetical protein
MVGDFLQMGGKSYLRINGNGTLEKLPHLKWYWVLYFIIKNHFQGNVDSNEVRKAAILNDK